MEKFDVVIIGGGPAGISAAIWCRRLNLNHILLESTENLGGQLKRTHNKIIDYPGVLTESGIELQKLMVEHVNAVHCNVKYNSYVKNIDTSNRHLTYSVDGKEKEIGYQFLILATGIMPRPLNIPGEKEMVNRGEVYSATRDKMRFKGKKVAIVGGGDRAFEGALLLAKAGANVHLFHRSSHFRARKAYKEEAVENKNIHIYTEAVLTAIHGNAKVECIEITQQGKKRLVNVEAVLIRIGVIPNSSLVNEKVEMDKQGYIFVNNMGQSSIPSIFAIGDVCNTEKYSSIAASVGQGMIAVKNIYEYFNND